jgi:ferredoxin
LELYAVLPKKKKPLGRRLTLFLVGLFLVGVTIFLGKENVQLEGFIFALLTGIVQMAVIHYFIAKIVGPLLSTECSLCQTCITVWPQDALSCRSGSTWAGRSFSESE